jgi:hypothetical protein
MLSQRYSGDITIVPDISYTDYPALMSNPTPEFLVEARLRGERATWPSTFPQCSMIANMLELSIIHNHCAIELALDNALYAMNVKMVFGNTPSLHHLRHRSHEPQVRSSIWDADQHTRRSDPQSSVKSNASHPSLALEITLMDVDNPNLSSETHNRFFPTILESHRSTPTTPSEQTKYRRRPAGSSPTNGELTLDWQALAFTALNTQQSGNLDNPLEPSTPSQSRRYGDRYLNAELPIFRQEPTDSQTQPPLTITPPSTPSFTTSALGSPTLTYSSRSGAMDASGTRRMMLKRKSSSFLRTPASSSNTLNENQSTTLHTSRTTS